MYAGIDIGSLVTKVVLMNGDRIASYSIIDSRADPRRAGELALEKALEKAGCERESIQATVVTGYGRVAYPAADKAITELSCHAKGAKFLVPVVRTVIDIGGQDSKVIKVDPEGNLGDFAMNDKCAAGTGRFLEVMAGALEISLEEMGLMSLRVETPCAMSSTCTVFAETEVVSLVASGAGKESIVAGMHESIAARVGSMAMKMGLEKEVVFVGGVAKNPGVREALQEVLGVEFAPIGEDPQIVGALGAAIAAGELAERRMHDDCPVA